MVYIAHRLLETVFQVGVTCVSSRAPSFRPTCFRPTGFRQILLGQVRLRLDEIDWMKTGWTKTGWTKMNWMKSRSIVSSKPCIGASNQGYCMVPQYWVALKVRLYTACFLGKSRDGGCYSRLLQKPSLEIMSSISRMNTGFLFRPEMSCKHV